MKITIKNFGPIDFLEFDLEKDLHLIYGQNAVGKSYATYCIYCLLKNFKDKVFKYYPSFYDEKKEDTFSTYIKNVVQNLKPKQVTNITNDYINLINNELSQILLNELQYSLHNTFSSLKNLRNRFTNQPYEIHITFSNREKIEILADDKGNLKLTYKPLPQTVLIEKSELLSKLIFKIGGKIISKRAKEDEFIIVLVHHTYGKISTILENLNNNIRELYFLPSSRSGLYQALSAFAPIIAELTQNRFFMNSKKIELPSLPEPVSDYFIDLSTINKQNENDKLQSIINILQNDILKGRISYDDGNHKIIYQPQKTDLELSLSESSSMVSEISPLVLYLKHIVNHKHLKKQENSRRNWRYRSSDEALYYDILFIEEPEAHLHPEVQVALMEVFAKLSTLNLKVFITTHSNYMFDKLNNLILSNELDNNKVAVYHLVKNENGSTYNKQVAVTKDGIEDENFQETSEKLYEERMRIYDK